MDMIPESFYELVYGPEKQGCLQAYMIALLRKCALSDRKTGFTILEWLKATGKTKDEAIKKFKADHPGERLFEARSVTSALKTYASFSEFSGEFTEIATECSETAE